MNAKLAFIAAHVAEHAVRLMCRVLSVSPSWFHAWRAATPDRAASRAAQDTMAARIRTIFEDSRARYGAPRIHAELVAQGERIARKTVARLMKQNGIRPPRRGRRVPRTTDSRHDLGIAPNLLARNFKVGTPDTVWLADISYVPTDESWLYQGVVLIFKVAVATGFDAPRAWTLVSVRPNRGRDFGLQIVGRIMRVHPSVRPIHGQDALLGQRLCPADRPRDAGWATGGGGRVEGGAREHRTDNRQSGRLRVRQRRRANRHGGRAADSRPSRRPRRRPRTNASNACRT